mgnify:FL=1
MDKISVNIRSILMGWAAADLGELDLTAQRQAALRAAVSKRKCEELAVALNVAHERNATKKALMERIWQERPRWGAMLRREQPGAAEQEEEDEEEEEDKEGEDGGVIRP